MKKITIVVVEDNRLLREGITAILSQEKDLTVAASHGDCSKAVQSIGQMQPDLVILDFGLRNQNSLKLVSQVLTTSPATKVIMMDLVPLQQEILDCVRAGVAGFILKDATITDFLSTIRAVFKGEKVLPTNLMDTLFSQIVSKAVADADPEKIIEAVRMTKRERQVIELVADGMTNKEIAQILHLSTYTIKSHIHNIMEKLAIHTRVQIAKYVNDSADYQSTLEALALRDR